MEENAVFFPRNVLIQEEEYSTVSGYLTASSSPTPASLTLTALRMGDSQLYVRRLLSKGHGYPLFRPQPSQDLPEAYRRTGACIGDVGVVTVDGYFDFIFNICAAPDSPINVLGVPRGFRPLALEPGAIFHAPVHHYPGCDISSTNISKRRLDLGVTVEDNVFSPIGAGSTVELTASAHELATLLLPDGGSRRNVRSLQSFESYALENGPEWYSFVNGRLRRKVENGSLYLITGVDKTSSWNVASLESGSADNSISLKLTAGLIGSGSASYAWKWTNQNSASICSGPSRAPGEDGWSDHQTVFIRGYKVAVRSALVAALKGSIKVTSTDSLKPSDVLRRTTDVPYAQSPSPQPSSTGGSTESRGGSKESGGHSDDGLITELENLHIETPQYHPSSVINDYLLGLEPSAVCAVTHDDAWISILKSDEPEMPDEDEILRRVRAKYSVGMKCGGVHFDIDDSEQYQLVAPRNNNWSFTLFSLSTFPFQLLYTLLRSLLGIFRILRPRHRYTPPRGDGDGDRWVRELEEETGALCMSSATQQTASGVDVGTSSSAASSTLSHRAPSDRKVLPEFTLGTYEDALVTCQRDARIACIVLVSEDHDDVPEFKRTTLTDPILVRLLHANDILVWGGDVRDREAYSASLKLQATTYPFVAFVALQPKRAPLQSKRTPRSANSSTSSTPTLTVLSRHQGPPSGPTSPAALAAHLETQLLPRVSPFLAQLRAAQHAAFADRALREEQDRAFRETAARDGARIEALMQAEAHAKREAEEARVAAKIEAARVASERDEKRKGWRRWTHRALANVPEDKDGVQLAVRLPDGERVVRRFQDKRSLTALYAFVDAQLVGEGSQDERSPKGHAAAELERAMEEQIADAEGADAWWGFQLVLAYPRREIPWESGSAVGDVECLKGGAQLVVRLLTPHKTVADDDDGL